jgi:hypothetical protein
VRPAAWALGAALALAPRLAAADDARARFALEVDAFGGYDVMVQGRSPLAREIWSRNGGGAIAGSLSFRTPWVSPFVDVGYYPLYASQSRVELGPGLGALRATSSLAAMGVLGGLGVEWWRLRLRAGIGLYDVAVRSTVLGETIAPREVDGGYLVTLRGAVVRSRRVDVGLEVRGGFIVEADTSFLSFGVTIGGDAIAF